jgi:hypothetical protein
MLEALLALSAIVNRMSEFIKAMIVAQFPNVSDDQKKVITLASSMVAGVFAAFGANLNVLADNATYAHIPPVIGILATGFLVSLGSEGIHVVYDLLYGWRDKLSVSSMSTTLTVANKGTSVGAAVDNHMNATLQAVSSDKRPAA